MDDIKQLARNFAALINANLNQHEISEINAINSKNPDFCASHDYMDSNALMYGAFGALFFREPDYFASDTDLMNKAWNIAKLAQFDLSKITD